MGIVETVAIDVRETAGDQDHHITVPDHRVVITNKIRTRQVVTTALGREKTDIVAATIGENGIGIEATEGVKRSETMTNDPREESASYSMISHVGSVAVEEKSEEAKAQHSAKRSLRLT